MSRPNESRHRRRRSSDREVPVPGSTGGQRFSPVPRRLAVDEVAARLRSEILGGGLAPGELLPPERDLAITLGVSRLTLRSAMARLVAQGLIHVRQGEGVRAADYRRQAGL